MIAKILRQKEVTVGIVVSCRNFKIGNLCTAFGFHGLRFAFVLRENSSKRKFPKLHFGLHPK